ERLNVPAIVLRFGITAATFYWWQTKGWPALGGEPLSSEPEPLSCMRRGAWVRNGLYGRTENTYVAKQVREVLLWRPYIDSSESKSSGWLNATSWRDRKGRNWLTELG